MDRRPVYDRQVLRVLVQPWLCAGVLVVGGCARVGFGLGTDVGLAGGDHRSAGDGLPLDGAPGSDGALADGPHERRDGGTPADGKQVDGKQVDSKQVAPSCPAGYLRIDPDPTVGTTAPFCVAKYEMKNSGNQAVSQAAGLPMVKLTRTAAKSLCTAAGGSLISNPEWMTIARDIERTAANWSTGVVGAGELNQGHADNVPPTQLAASTDDADACFGTGQVCSDKVWHSERRTFKLSSGDVIWDFAGNADEWIDWAPATFASPQGELNSANPSADMPLASYRPAGATLTSANRIGSYIINGSSASAMRGGSSGGGYKENQVGIYTLLVGWNPTVAFADQGFRCTVHP